MADSGNTGRDRPDRAADPAKQASPGDPARQAGPGETAREATGDPAKKEADALARHPGRPRAPGELDPELIRLPRRRTRISPVLSATIVLFSLYLMARLWSDLSFSRQDEPARLSLAEAIEADRNDYVEVKAVPDLANLLRVTEGFASDGQRAAPVLGTDGALWILTDGSTWGDATPDAQNFRGRLYSLGDLPFDQALRDHIATMPPVLEPVAPDELAAALKSGASAVTSLSGDPIAVDANTEVAIRETVAGQALVTVGVTDGYADEAAWRAALVRAGILPRPQPPMTSSEVSWTYLVPAPDGVAALERALAAAKLYAAAASPLVRRYQTTWSELELRGGELVVDGVVLPRRDVSTAGIATRPSATEATTVLVTTERPGDYWYLIPVYLLLALFAALFSWVLWRTLRVDADPS